MPKERDKVKTADDVAAAYAALPEDRKRAVAAMIDDAADPVPMPAAEVAAAYEAMGPVEQMRVPRIAQRSAARAERPS